MDWGAVAKLVAPLAPGLGGLLGGLIPFPGAGLAGQAIGSIIARQFGVSATPEAVAGALNANPNEVILAKLQAASAEAQAQWPALAEMEKAWAATMATAITQVNETMRVEALPENRHWFFTGWRPAAGWLFVISAAAFFFCLTVATWYAVVNDNAKALKAISDNWPIFLSYFGILAAMVGVYIVGRSSEKAKLIEAAPPAVTTTTTTQTVKKK